MAKAYIMVVDDEPDIRQLLQEILEDEDYEVAVAHNGASARALRATRRPDLILLDIWMPDEDGITLLKFWLNEDQSASPVIMMSGHATVETAVEATRLGEAGKHRTQTTCGGVGRTHWQKRCHGEAP